MLQEKAAHITFWGIIGAGAVEKLKNGNYPDLVNPMIMLRPPYGDAQTDYKWNTAGMRRAENETQTNSPISTFLRPYGGFSF